jgi:hypothetical protein
VRNTGPRSSSGLSRRGWILLAAGTAVVMAGLATVGVLAVGSVGHALAGGAESAATSSDAPRIPRGEPNPTPLGLPPRPTATEVATVPSQPIASIAPGACLQVYPSKTAAAYPVVDCAEPHIAQLVSEGELPQASGGAYPGTTALDSQVGDLCAAPGLNWHWVAVWGEDVMTDLRYPDAGQWDAGARQYYCIVYTYSRHELTGSAMPGS